MATPLPLHDRHAAHDAEFVDYGGREMATHYGPVDREVAAVREGCGVLDWSGGTRLRVTQAGARSAVDFLEGMLSNQVTNLPAHGGAYATFLTHTGKVLADCWAWPREEGVLLATCCDAGAVLREKLAKFGFLDDIEVADASDELGMLGLYGPRAAEAFDGAFEAALPGIEADALEPVAGPHGEALVARAALTGEVGFHVLGAPDVLGVLWDRLVEAGAAPVGLDAFHVLRVEAGVPWVGAELDERVLPNQAGAEHAVSYTKGCYVGQEAVAKLHYLSRQSKGLIGLRLGDAPPPAYDTELTLEGKNVGRVTSAVRSPALGETVAIAFCRNTQKVTPGTQVAVGEGGTATVVDLPFHRRGTWPQTFRESDIRDGLGPNELS